MISNNSRIIRPLSSVRSLIWWNVWRPNLFGAPEQTVPEGIVINSTASWSRFVFRVEHDKQPCLLSSALIENDEHAGHVMLDSQRLKLPDRLWPDVLRNLVSLPFRRSDKSHQVVSQFRDANLMCNPDGVGAWTAGDS